MKKWIIMMIIIGVISLPTLFQVGMITYLNITKTTTFTLDESDSSKLIMNGEINSKTLDQLKEELSKNDGIKTLVLMNVPGSVNDDANIKLCYYVREKGLNTYITSESDIASGGTDLYLAGVKRYYEEGAKIGVHSWGGIFKEATDFPKDHENHQLYTEYTKNMLGSDRFYWFTIESAKAKDIHYMTTEEIQEYSLYTDFVK